MSQKPVHVTVKRDVPVHIHVSKTAKTAAVAAGPAGRATSTTASKPGAKAPRGGLSEATNAPAKAGKTYPPPALKQQAQSEAAATVVTTSFSPPSFQDRIRQCYHPSETRDHPHLVKQGQSNVVPLSSVHKCSHHKCCHRPGLADTLAQARFCEDQIDNIRETVGAVL